MMIVITTTCCSRRCCSSGDSYYRRSLMSRYFVCFCSSLCVFFSLSNSIVSLCVLSPSFDCMPLWEKLAAMYCYVISLFIRFMPPALALWCCLCSYFLLINIKQQLINRVSAAHGRRERRKTSDRRLCMNGPALNGGRIRARLGVSYLARRSIKMPLTILLDTIGHEKYSTVVCDLCCAGQRHLLKASSYTQATPKVGN